jgi:SAM-dependent methyltransferase
MNRDLFYSLVILTIILLSLWIYQKNYSLGLSEGFQQKERFLLKTDMSSYDDFYCEIYDKIMLPENRAIYEIDEVLKTLQPEKRFSTMLDVGSGTGAVISTLQKRGYKSYGIDHSQSMIDTSKRNYPDLSIEVKCDNVENPMAFDRALFTHIFCMNFTIYEIKNKLAFFKNCFYWLQNNGYLVLHLAEKDKFNAIVPAAMPLTGFDMLGKRLLKTEIDFGSFKYASEYVASDPSDQMIFKESFIDKQTHNIRQNERTLYMESPEDIIMIARKAGFVGKGSLSLESGPTRDGWQQVIILERVS